MAIPKLNNAQQLALAAAKVRKQQESMVVAGIETVYPQLRAKALAAANRGEINMQIGAVSDKVIYDAVNNPKGLETLKAEGFIVNVTQIAGQWCLDIYWDSGNPANQVVDTTTTV